MAHKTMVGGTAYNITGGKSMVSGTVYNISGGRTMVGGTGYDISFAPKVTNMFAVLYNSNYTLEFWENEADITGGTVRNCWNFTSDNHFNDSTPWRYSRDYIRNICAGNSFRPVDMARWFNNCQKLNYVNWTNFDLSKTTNMHLTFYNCYNLKTPPVCGNKVTNFYSAYYNCQNITGNAACGDSVINMSRAYRDCNKLNGSPACGKNVVDMCLAYYECHNITGNAACGDNVVDMYAAYHNCYRLNGSPACGKSVVNMGSTYYGCTNITGNAACGDNVVYMAHTYSNCHNLNGSPVCGKNVVNMSCAYRNCYNITGNAACGDNVVDMTVTYANCYRLNGSPACGKSVVDMVNTYYECRNIRGNAYFYSENVTDMSACFANKSNNYCVNIYVKNNSKTLKALLGTGSNSIFYFNGSWPGNSYNGTCYSFGQKNLYIYPVNSVYEAYANNECDVTLSSPSYGKDVEEVNGVIRPRTTISYSYNMHVVATNNAYEMHRVNIPTPTDFSNVIVKKVEVIYE